MLEFFKIVVHLVFLSSCAKCFDSFDSEKILFNSGKIEAYSNGLKNDYSKTIEIKFKIEENKMI